MENASKALIIAGAILLSILIIGLGMFIYTQAANVMGDANLNKEQVQAYNTQFENYEGKQSGTQVRALLSLIRSHNNANIDDETLQVGVAKAIGTEGAAVAEGGAQANLSNINTLRALIKAGKSYRVTFSYDSASGYITAVTIANETAATE